MEPGEEITEAAIREVKEETGLDFEPSTLLSVEAAGKTTLHIYFNLQRYVLDQGLDSALVTISNLLHL